MNARLCRPDVASNKGLEIRAEVRRSGEAQGSGHGSVGLAGSFLAGALIRSGYRVRARWFIRLRSGRKSWHV